MVVCDHNSTLYREALMTGIFISHVVLGVVTACGGFFAGWAGCKRLTKRTTLQPRDERRLWEYISRLHGLSSRMVVDVNAHNTTLGGIDHELSQIENRNVSVVSELVERLITANEVVQAKLRENERKVGEIASEMEHRTNEARTDVLTGLPNRRAFQEEALRCRANALATGQPLSLVMIDIDHFKQVNDVRGHLVGDETLCKVARIVRDQFRGRDIVTRYGGEEFSVLLPGTAIGDARHVADHVRKVVENTRLAIGGSSFGVTISLGVAQLLSQEEVADILKRADLALYAAKNAGRNRVYWHDGSHARALHLERDRTMEGNQRRNDSRIAETHSLPQKQVASANDLTALPQPVSEATADRNAEEQNIDVLQAHDVDMRTLENMHNKMVLCQDVRRRISHFNRDGSLFVTILLGIDDGEEIIRVHGESALTLVRSVVAQAIHDRIRITDLLAVYDGITFGIVLPDRSSYEAVNLCERIRETIERTDFQVDRELLRATVSLGVADVERGDHMERLLERAYRQLEKAQRGGGNRTSVSADTLVVR
ncbi:MAG: diguanylate cyclase [Pirellulaceae bacterium]